MGAKITLKGRLGGEPTFGETKEGKPWVSFSLRQDHMVRSGKQLADGRDEYVDNGGFWMQVVWFSRKAENAADVLKKGSAVVVSGDLRAEQWESKETGELQSGFKVVADDVSLDFIGLESVTYQPKESGGAPSPRPNVGKSKARSEGQGGEQQGAASPRPNVGKGKARSEGQGGEQQGAATASQSAAADSEAAFGDDDIPF